MVVIPMQRFTMEDYLKGIYYNIEHEAGLGGIEKLYKAVKLDGKYDLNRQQISDFLIKQETYTLHKPIRRNFTKNRVLVISIDEQWVMDLCDLSSLARYNREYKFLLTCIDAFSKYAWVQPLKNKKGQSILKAFQKILNKSDRIPIQIQSDKGTEFLNKEFQKFIKQKNIKIFTTGNFTKASIVERFNRTLKTKIWKYFTHHNTWKYIDVLPKIVKTYNNTFHSSIKMKPINVNKDNESRVWITLYRKKAPPSVKSTFKIGDQVRISKFKMPFDKGYYPNWSEEIFTISKHVGKQRPVYRIKDFNDEEIDGTFYEQELQKITKIDDVFKIEKVLKKRKRKGKNQEYFVKWMGYPTKFNSWVTDLHQTGR